MNLIPIEGSSKVKFQPIFPYTDEICTRCASCKRNHIVTIAGDDDIIVYIGEGYSDRCPVRYADVVFAKDDLLRYCRKNHIPRYEYKTFKDIKNQLHKMMHTTSSNSSKGFLRKRRQAELARKELFLCE